MNPFNSAGERFVTLHTGQIRQLRGAARLRVTRGTVWLTVNGQTDDHILLPGDRFTLANGRDALAQALSGRACFVVAEHAPSWTQRSIATLRAASQRVTGAPA